MTPEIVEGIPVLTVDVDYSRLRTDNTEVFEATQTAKTDNPGPYTTTFVKAGQGDEMDRFFATLNADQVGTVVPGTLDAFVAIEGISLIPFGEKDPEGSIYDNGLTTGIYVTSETEEGLNRVREMLSKNAPSLVEKEDYKPGFIQ